MGQTKNEKERTFKNEYGASQGLEEHISRRLGRELTCGVFKNTKLAQGGFQCWWISLLMASMESLQGEKENGDLYFDVGARLVWLGDGESKKKKRTTRKTLGCWFGLEIEDGKERRWVPLISK